MAIPEHQVPPIERHSVPPNKNINLASRPGPHSKKSADEAQPLQFQQQIRKSLEHEILEGRMLPGERLDEQEIALRFGVSRTPVREALLQLSITGLVQFRPRHGATVARLSLKEIMSIWEVLVGLEGMCAELAARRMTPDELARLMQLHEQSRLLVDREDVGGYASANQDIHEVIYASCRNGCLQRLILDMRRRLRIYRRYPFERAGGLQRSFDGHDQVVRAIEAGNHVQAGIAMRDHVTSGGASISDFIAELPDQFADGLVGD